MSEFKFSCSHCGQHILCDALWSGREINCPACQQPLVVPSLAPPVSKSTTTGPPRVKEPSGRSVKYHHYEDVPWYRRSTPNHIFAISGLLCLPPLVWWVAIMCLTGDIYKKGLNKDGNLKIWGMFSKVFSVILVACQISILIYAVLETGSDVASHSSPGSYESNTLGKPTGEQTASEELLRQPAQISRDSNMAESAVDVARAPSESNRQSVQCENNLKQMGLAFMTWDLDHDGKFPFNVSISNGGTKELCDRGSDGFDRNAAHHFQVLSSDLVFPKILVCPADTTKRPAADFSKLQAVNVTYRVRSGANISSVFTNEVLVICPVHNHVLRCDGRVKRGI